MENVIITNSAQFKNIKAEIKNNGRNKLHVLADFDRTLTYAYINGERVPAVIYELMEQDWLGEDYKKESFELYNRYHKIELDSGIADRDKRMAMREWWEKHFEILIKYGLNIKHIEDIVKSERIRFREGVLQFLDFLNDNRIPLIILSSSGLGNDSIRLFLQKEKRLHKNIHIVSNEFKWDKSGNAIGVKEPIIHSLNKDETVLKNFDFYPEISERENVILLGDNIEDIGMAKGINHKNIIKIGFLNEKIDDNLEFYKKAFDVVILNDSDFGFINGLIEEIIP